MRVERIAQDKVRIFVSYDDLEARGIDRDEIWQNGRKVQELFWDMMETAYVEVGFEIAGPIAVEAFTMPTQGVVVIVTRVPSLPSAQSDDDDDDFEDIFEPDVFSSFIFEFSDFEEVVRASHAIADFGANARLYRYKDAYQLYFDEESIDESQADSLWAVVSEYGSPSKLTTAVLDEYGNCIIKEHAVGSLVDKFPLY